nr:hypothetical protein [Tanacetum cinerariifolium]
ASRALGGLAEQRDGAREVNLVEVGFVHHDNRLVARLAREANNLGVAGLAVKHNLAVVAGGGVKGVLYPVLELEHYWATGIDEL